MLHCPLACDYEILPACLEATIQLVMTNGPLPHRRSNDPLADMIKDSFLNFYASGSPAFRTT
jgi:hypothetical protein